ncbi:hypothetical protein C1645_773390 [Glomus cerebriforme]|uniref:Uncharacterized protein n=1 Tax=Glomus cerebriforme TaxID=658196 RepID=A0A397SZ37_9GLOM|nr:hypothetical protein C1645_773390 [Glomus cerebriforme]
MQQFFSKTMPVSVSRKLLEEHNNNNHHQGLSSSPLSYISSHSSLSPETFDPTIGDHSLYRQPTFTYIPIHKRRRSALLFSRSMSLNSLSMSVPSQHSSSLTTTNLSSSPSESEVPSTPTSLCSSSSDQSMEYTSFPNLEKFSDEGWTEVRVEKRDNILSDIEMESYDEMFVAGVRFQYS